MPLRFLADENFPGYVVRSLRERGFDVEWISEISPSVRDSLVVQISRETDRTLLTLDKGFGDMAFRQRIFPDAGIVLFRLRASQLENNLEFAVDALQSRSDWTGRFTVIEIDKIRSSPLPKV